jgi:hypothetical protein
MRAPLDVGREAEVYAWGDVADGTIVEDTISIYRGDRYELVS